MADIAATEEGITERELKMSEVALKKIVVGYGDAADENISNEKIKAFASEQLDAIKKQRKELRHEQEPKSKNESSESPQR